MKSDPKPVVICGYFHYFPRTWVWLHFYAQYRSEEISPGEGKRGKYLVKEKVMMDRQRGRQTAFPLVHSTLWRTRVALEVHIKNHQTNRVCAYTSVGSLKWREVNSYRSFHIDIGRIHLLQSETIQDLLSYLFARTLAKRSYLALLFTFRGVFVLKSGLRILIWAP